MIKIRKAEIDDLEGITSIYNDAIKNTVATFDTEIKTLDEQKAWFNEHGKHNPLIVAEEGDDIVGWAALTQYSTKCAYSDTAEISLYVKEDYQGKSIGRKLIEGIVKAGEEAGLHTLIARITEGNQISIHLHESVGFKHVGIYKEVGYKFGKHLDVTLMQKVYKNK
jgi:phosphinothricin acetyltransferase